MSVRSAADVLTDPKQGRDVKVNQLHRDVRVNAKNFFKIVPQTEYSYQIGIIVMPDHLKRRNRGRHEILFVLDVVSRKVFVRVLNSKSDVTHIREAYDDIVSKDLAPAGASPSAITADERIERMFSLTENSRRSSASTIKYYYVHRDEDNTTRGFRLGLLDRAVRSIRLLMARYLTATGDVRWSLWLQSVIDFYNNRRHRSLVTTEETVLPDGSTKFKKVFWEPDRVFVRDRHRTFYLQALLNGTNLNDALVRKSRFRVGDRVRVITSRPPRSSAANFSDAACTVVGKNFRVESGDPSEQSSQSGFRYRVLCDDRHDERAHEGFKEWELVLIKRQRSQRDGPSTGQWTTTIISR